jgi:hypothetical protein
MALILSVIPALINARPSPQSPDTVGPPYCPPSTNYEDSNNYDAESLPMQFGGSCDPGTTDGSSMLCSTCRGRGLWLIIVTGCQIGLTEEVSFTVTVNVGFDFGIDTDAVGAGISAGVEFSYGTATSESTGVMCSSGDYQCGSVWFAGLRRVEGTAYRTETCTSSSSSPYSVDYPRTDDNGIILFRQAACVCPNFNQPDPLPYALCPEDCA